MARKKRASKLKTTNNSSRVDRKQALTWLVFGIVVGGILMFTLIQGSLLSPSFSPSPVNDLGLQCTFLTVGAGEGISCNEECSTIGKSCVVGQDTSGKSFVGCPVINNGDNPTICVCC